MTSSNFPEPPKELQRVAEEISSLRRELQATSASLSRIERRLKAIYPNYPSRKGDSKKKKVTPSADKSLEELSSKFHQIVDATKENGEEGFDNAIASISESDLLAIAIEVGAGTPSKLTASKAKIGIRKRVQESLQLSFQGRKSGEKGYRSK